MNVHDIVEKAELLGDRIIRGEQPLEQILLTYGSLIDETDWKQYKEAVEQWHAIKVYYEDVREGLLKVQKWMEEMGYDEDIEDDEEEE